MNSIQVVAALSMGFLGSLHCVGMCGPIMLILPFQQLSGWQKGLAIGLYHFGRISVYAIMGAALFSFKLLFDPSVEQMISIILGIVLLLLGILSFIGKGAFRFNPPWLSFIKTQTAKVLGSTAPHKLLFAGILNGMLPCGLVYTALSLTTTAQSPYNAMGLMYLFGIGTTPALVSISLLKTKIKFLQGEQLRKLVPVVMLAFGVLFMIRGMNLGIPYLSPKMEVKSSGEVKSSCCQKQ